MNANTSKLSALTLAVGTTLAVSANAGAADNPFGMQQLPGGYMQLADGSMLEGKCGGSKRAGEGKCGGSKSAGEGKCGGSKSAGEGKCGGSKSAGEGKCGASGSRSISVLEGKCGEGRCGSSRVRRMMDSNGDGRIDRKEYIGWATRQAGAEFDEMAGGADSVSPEDAFQNFLRWEAASHHSG